MTTETQFDWAGVIFGLVVAGIGFAGSYFLWPSGALDSPISTLTLGDLFRVAGSIFLGLVGIVGVIWAVKDANEPFGAE